MWRSILEKDSPYRASIVAVVLSRRFFAGRLLRAGKPTSSLLRALRSALYSMLTSVVPAPPVERYVYLELLAIAEDIFFSASGFDEVVRFFTCSAGLESFLAYPHCSGALRSQGSSCSPLAKSSRCGLGRRLSPLPPSLFPRSFSSSSSGFRSRPAPYS